MRVHKGTRCVAHEGPGSSLPRCSRCRQQMPPLCTQRPACSAAAGQARKAAAFAAFRQHGHGVRVGGGAALTQLPHDDPPGEDVAGGGGRLAIEDLRGLAGGRWAGSHVQGGGGGTAGQQARGRGGSCQAQEVAGGRRLSAKDSTGSEGRTKPEGGCLLGHIDACLPAPPGSGEGQQARRVLTSQRGFMLAMVDRPLPVSSTILERLKSATWGGRQAGVEAHRPAWSQLLPRESQARMRNWSLLN